MTAEVRKLHHIGIDKVPKRSTLSDDNARRPEKFFEDVYRDLYESNKDKLTSDSRRNGTEEWIKQLCIIDTTISLFSYVIFKGLGRHPKTGKKKGSIKVHSVIHANEGVPCDVRFTSAATNDSFMLPPSYYSKNEIVALDRAYINYAKFEELTERDSRREIYPDCRAVEVRHRTAASGSLLYLGRLTERGVSFFGGLHILDFFANFTS